MPWFSTHLTLPFIKTPYSWLFHITKIYTSEYIIKNSKNNIIIHCVILWNYRKFTKWYKYRIHCKILFFFVLLKTWIKITTKSRVLLKKIKTTIEIYGFLLESSYNYSHFSPKLCLEMFLFSKTSPFGQSQVSSSWFKTNKNSNQKSSMIIPYPKCLFIQNHMIIQPP